MAKRILVVDDDENILSLERTILEQKGFQVTTAGGGEEALKLMREQDFDLVLLDSTPLVGPDAEYCRAIGFTDGRTVCPVRMEGNPERSACEALRVGRASDTGRPGPTWSANGKRCDGPDGGTACLNHSENQYLAWAYGSGTFRACAASGVCGELVVP